MKVADLTIDEFEGLIHRVIEEEMDDLYFLIHPTIKAKIEEGLEDIEEGRVISLDDLIAQRKTKSGKI